VTSRELRLNQEELGVGMVLDMEIARRAGVFIGNGVRLPIISVHPRQAKKWVQWSSFSSNIVHQRLLDEKDPISIRFWWSGDLQAGIEDAIPEQ
jgi:hypothetical protein